MIELLNQINILSLNNPDKLDYIKSFLDENHDYWALLRSVENKLITLPEIYKVFDNVTITYLYKNGYKKFISTLFATSSENDINWLMKYLLDNPTTEFCSWINVFFPNFLAALITGAVTYPPAPITTSGLNSLIIFLHFFLAFKESVRTLIFSKVSFLFKPLTLIPA